MKKYNKAFTIVELLVSIGIMTLVLSVVLWNYRSFNDELELSRTIQEMAINIRQAQVYGINVREASSGTNEFNYAYGVYLNSDSGFGHIYIIFIDSNNNNKYDYSVDILVEAVNLQNNIAISAICDLATCPATGTSILNVTFLRPNPDARIYFADSANDIISGPNAAARIRLTSPGGKESYIIIENTGQITIQ